MPDAQDQLGQLTPDRNDPAWQPPRDPLKDPQTQAKASLIYREIPNLAVQTSWSVADVRGALANLTAGMFDQPAQLVDAIIGDDRVQATMGSRTGGLFAKPLKHYASTLPGVDAGAAAECRDAWARVWPKLMTEPTLSELQQWSIGLGFGLGQILWDMDPALNVPYLRIFHPRFSYYHWTLRRYVAITLDGQVAIEPGDGKWLLHAPHGEYRGWMRGAVRAVAQPWLIRNFAYRDWARYSERHGMPIVKAMMPAAGDPAMVAAFRSQLGALGQESIAELPQGVDKNFSYDLDFLEASDQAWQGFDGLIQKCEASIVLAILWQNLTTQVSGGSFAAASIHMDVRHAALEADARALSQTIYTQLARPFAAFNFGDADLAPRSEWDLMPTEELDEHAKVFLAFSQSIYQLRQSGIEISDLPKLARQFGIGLDPDDLKEVQPLTGSGAGGPGGGGKEEGRRAA